MCYVWFALITDATVSAPSSSNGGRGGRALSGPGSHMPTSSWPRSAGSWLPLSCWSPTRKTVRGRQLAGTEETLEDPSELAWARPLNLYVTGLKQPGDHGQLLLSGWHWDC